MAKQTTRDAALSRLFGNADSGEAPSSSRSPKEPESETAHEITPKETPIRQVARPGNEATEETDIRKQGRGEAAPAPGTTEADQPSSGYIGLGRYTRADGIVERITPYVRPDQAEALRLAVARKNDPRGTDVSQIIQALLDEAGYRS